MSTHYKAVEQQNISVLKFLLNNDSVDVLAKNENGISLMDLAHQIGDPDIIRLLENHSHTPQKYTQKSIDPISMSATGSTKTSGVLIRKGARVNCSNTVKGNIVAGGDVTINIDKTFYGKRRKISEHEEIENINALLEIDKQDDFEITNPMFVAAKAGDLNELQNLINQGENVFEKSPDGRTLLHYAAQNDKDTCVRYLMSLGLDVHSKNDKGFTPLHYAAMNGRLNTMKFIIENGGDINVKCQDGQNLLHFAARHGHNNCLEYLIDHGLDVDSKNGRNETPLHVAICEGHLSSVQHLIDRGANFLNRIDDNKNAIYIQAGNENEQYEYGIRYEDQIGFNDSIDALHLAASYGHLNIIKYLVEKGSNATLESDFGFTGLHQAAKGSNIECIKYFLDIGVDINATTYSDCCTAFHVAAINGKLVSLKYLWKMGADIFARESHLFNALHLATRNKQLHCIPFLLEIGFDVDCTGYNDYTPFHYAAKDGDLETMKYLFEKGANIFAEYRGGGNSLLLASQSQNDECVKFLRDYGNIFSEQ